MKKIFMRVFSLLLCLFQSITFLSCSNTFYDGEIMSDDSTSASAQKESSTIESINDSEEKTEDTGSEKENQEKVDLNGKKILIIGNSYVFYGRTTLYTATAVRDQISRSGDKGFFYQLCKENGYDVSVTNWTFSGHGLYDLCDTPCTHSACKGGIIHEVALIDPVYDYVVISPGGGDLSEKYFVENFDHLCKFFRAANPNVKIVCLGNLGAHGYSSFGTVEPGICSHYKNLEKQGVIIADWGGLVNGIIDGIYKVPGATQKYSAKTFIVKDGYHPNPLAGYITTLMAYCAITGESPIGQPYDFCTDKTINVKFDMVDYISDYYVNGNTNFLDVFQSESDMLGIQQLIAQYLKNKPYLMA